MAPTENKWASIQSCAKADARRRNEGDEEIDQQPQSRRVTSEHSAQHGHEL
jgi:hypothetical protein